MTTRNGRSADQPKRMIDLTLDATIEQMIFDAHLQPFDSAISETVEPKDGQLSDSVRAIRELATRFRGSARAALLVVGVQAALEGDALVLTRGEDRVLIVAASEAMLQVGTQTIELHSPAGGSASVYKAVVSLVLDWAIERMKYDGR